MKRRTYVTTSWDDGHPLDFRVADLLAKYGVIGTFYVPKTSEYGTMSQAQVRELGGNFEIGAHTLNHVDLFATTDETARKEINGSKSWVEDTTGQPCQMFCPPRGHYSHNHLRLVRNAGFSAIRTVELLSLSFPQPRTGLVVMPTTIQAHPHAFTAYARNTVKRGAFRNLWLYATHGGSNDWERLALSLLKHVLEHGGVFRLWGHSWEIEQTGQWHALERVLKVVNQLTEPSQRLTNQQICQPANEIGHRAATQDSRTVLLSTCPKCA